jgi:phosphoketolase
VAICTRRALCCGASRIDAYWRAANYLSVGQIYLYDNPLLKRPLIAADVKHMLLGTLGHDAGQNFIYVHLNRVIKKYDLDMIYVSGPDTAGRRWWQHLSRGHLQRDLSQHQSG